MLSAECGIEDEREHEDEDERAGATGTRFQQQPGRWQVSGYKRTAPL